MTHSKTVYIKHAIALTAADYEGIITFLKEKGYSVNAYVSCVGDSGISPKIPEDLLAISNSADERVTALMIHGVRHPPYASVDMTFSDSFYVPCRLYVSGEEEDVYVLIERLRRKFSRAKPTYNLLAYNIWIHLLLALAYALCMMCVISQAAKVSAFLSYALSAFLGWSVFGGLTLIRRWLWPQFVFLVGMEEKRQESIGKLRFWILTAFLSAILGVLGTSVTIAVKSGLFQ